MSRNLTFTLNLHFLQLLLVSKLSTQPITKSPLIHLKVVCSVLLIKNVNSLLSFSFFQSSWMCHVRSSGDQTDYEVALDDVPLWLMQSDSELLPYSKGSAVRDIHLVTPCISADWPPPRFWLHPRGKDASLETDTHQSGFPLMSGFSCCNPLLSVDCILKPQFRDLSTAQLVTRECLVFVRESVFIPER